MVVPAVKMAGEADDLLLLPVNARDDAQREVRRLRAGNRETHPFRGRDHSLNQFGPLHFQGVAGAVMRRLSPPAP